MSGTHLRLLIGLVCHRVRQSPNGVLGIFMHRHAPLSIDAGFRIPQNFTVTEKTITIISSVGTSFIIL